MGRGIVVGAPARAAQIVAPELGLEEVVDWGLHASPPLDEPNDKAAEEVDKTGGERADQQGCLALQAKRYVAHPGLLQAADHTALATFSGSCSSQVIRLGKRKPRVRVCRKPDVFTPVGKTWQTRTPLPRSSLLSASPKISSPALLAA